jgi:tetratricopeptide (TPR) repeat protein
MMSELLYWGDGGRYGPYTAQADGWPNAGEVMRDYRVKMGMSAEEAAKRYSEALAQQIGSGKKGQRTKSITASWILNMENENRVPTDLTRRRLLADLLGIPYALFGLASLENVAFKPSLSIPSQIPLSTKPPLVKKGFEDIERYAKEIPLLWQLHYTSTAYHMLNNIDTAIASLEALEKLSDGNLYQHIQELLNSYYQLGNVITKDQGAFARSYSYANHAVRVTKNTGQEQRVATARYRRGYTSLVWGLFGEVDSIGAFKRDTDKITAAIRDFKRALPHAHPQLKGFLWLELSRAYSSLLQNPTEVSIALSLIEQAEDVIDVGALNDPYTPMKSLNQGMHLLGKAITLTYVGRSEEATEVLDGLEYLQDNKGIGRDQVRQQAWIDILYAQASLRSKDYYEAIRRATSAFLVCKDIHSLNNIAIINDLYCQLQKSPYKNHQEVADLGHMLARSAQFQKGKRE